LIDPPFWGGATQDQSLHGARGGQHKAVLSDSIAADLVKKSFSSTMTFMFPPGPWRRFIHFWYRIALAILYKKKIKEKKK